MSRRNQGRTSPFANEPKSSENLFAADEKILGAINAADASMIVAHPTSIDSMEPDPRQPRRATPSAVRQLMASQKNLYQPVRFLLVNWARMAYAEANGRETTEAVLEKYRGCITGDGEIPQVSERDTPIQYALYQVMGLAATIFQDGLINPITIVKHPDAGSRYPYMIETGERRWLAHHLLVYFGYKDYDKIPAQTVEFNVWRQANENGRRDELNAIARARQFALLLMNLLEQDGATFAPMSSFQHEREFYAQVADADQYRVPHGSLMKIAEAMGMKARQSINDYRRLLSLPDNVWVIADDQSWSRDDLLKIVRDADISDDLEQEPDADPSPAAPVGESEPIPNIATPEPSTPAPLHQHEPASDGAYRFVTLTGAVIPDGNWVDAYKDLCKDFTWYLVAVEARDGFIFLRGQAKTALAAVPTTMPGCHHTHTEHGHTFFCPQAVIDYLAQSHHMAICRMVGDQFAGASDFWHTHMVKNRQQRPAAAKPPPAAPPPQKWIPTVGEQVVVRLSGHLGKVTGLYLPNVQVRTKFGSRLYAIAELRAATDADLERDVPPPGFESPGETGLPELPLNQMLDYIRQHSSYGRVPWSARRAGSGVFVDDGAGVNLGKLFWNSGFGEYLARLIAAVFTLILPSAASRAFIRIRSFEENGGNPSYLPGDAVQDARDVIEYLHGFIDRTEREMDWGPEDE